MKSRGFEVARLGELERFENEFATIPVRIPLGIRAFGVNAYAAREEGGRIIEEHDELGAGAGHHEELYVVLSGRAVFTLDGEEVDAPAGTFVFVRDPATRRTAHAAEGDTNVLVVGGTAGQAFEPSPWESWLEALPHYRAQDYSRAVEVMRRALDEHPTIRTSFTTWPAASRLAARPARRSSISAGRRSSTRECRNGRRPTPTWTPSGESLASRPRR